eukprot:gnl/Spiro4/5375_TR2737_c0_g1_i1.p1 gnl/Spiro4/5375_TR2737_c0_g1~~gnl/Spiro4/5375_TR2737_c0_g1_i1.p1  ORF type:complete len:497 (-),score=67.56 gnl/Spiro4/5375_TR2737_c0_g1_i1:138-1628(-)
MDHMAAQGGSRDDCDVPPYSRVFVVCGKNATEQQMANLFSQCGTVQNVKITRHRDTNEPKGFCFVKFERASAAAAAVEKLHGFPMGSDAPPLKVIIANAKGSPNNQHQPESKDPDDIPARSRLFVVLPKEMTDEDLQQMFSRFGELESYRVVKDRATGLSKGIAYVKYPKASMAAIALEEINSEHQDGERKIKVVFAEPKGSKQFMAGPAGPAGPLLATAHMNNMGQYGGMQMQTLSAYPVPGQYVDYGVPLQATQTTQPNCRLYVVCHRSMSQDTLVRAFARFPGLESVDLKRDKRTGESKGFAFVSYSSAQVAAMVKDQMNDFMFPNGTRIKVVFAEKPGFAGAAEQQSQPQQHTYHAPMTPAYAGVGVGVPQMHAGMYGSYPPPLGMQSNMVEMSSQSEDSTENTRLFVVTKQPVSEYILNDVFGYIPGLEYVRVIPGKTYGYVKYKTAQAARTAMHHFNDKEILGQKLRVMIADPPPSGDGQDRGRKRGRDE